eukprot:gene24453-10054_t
MLNSKRYDLDVTALYPTHVPLDMISKGALAAMSAVGALIRPARADLVAAVGETSPFSTTLLKQLATRMRNDAVGQQILSERPRVTSQAVAPCLDMPEGSFGAAYARFMGDRNFSADDRPPVRFVDDEELAYVLTRMREVHDFWHVLFDCQTNVFGEIAVKSMEFVQTGMPMTGLAVAGAQWKLKSEDRDLLQRVYLPWSYRAGTRCHDLMNIYYERHFEEDLDAMRMRLRIIPAPPVPDYMRRKQNKNKAP